MRRGWMSAAVASLGQLVKPQCLFIETKVIRQDVGQSFPVAGVQAVRPVLQYLTVRVISRAICTPVAPVLRAIFSRSSSRIPPVREYLGVEVSGPIMVRLSRRPVHPGRVPLEVHHLLSIFSPLAERSPSAFRQGLPPRACGPETAYREKLGRVS